MRLDLYNFLSCASIILPNKTESLLLDRLDVLRIDLVSKTERELLTPRQTCACVVPLQSHCCSIAFGKVEAR